MPLLAVVLFGIVVYGSYLSTVHSVQQLAAEAARASIAGVTDTERRRMVEDALERNARSYPFVKRERLSVDRAALDEQKQTYFVELRYDASTLFIFRLASFVPLPDPQIRRSAAIQRGGY